MEKKPTSLQLVGLDLVFMEKATVYVHKTRYSKHIFDHAKYYSICFMDQEHKNQLG